MRLVSSFAVLAVLVTVHAASSADDKAYEIKVKKTAKGDRTENNSVEEGTTAFAIEIMGQAKKNNEKRGVKKVYTEEILERPDGAKMSTKLRRVYQTAEITEKGKKKTEAYEGKTVLIEKKGEKYVFSADGEKLEAGEADDLEKEFNKKDDIPLENEDFLPGKPVKLNESWTVDIDKVVKSFENSGVFTLRPEQTKVTGKLTKVYEKNGRQYGLITLDIVLAVKEMKSDGNEIPIKAGSTLKAVITIDGCIDGSSHSGVDDTELTIDLTGEIPNGTIAIKGKAKIHKTTKDLADK
ncbi:hypothetical protein [Fimbriiglobus ruber]|uniref:Uncharacterized protein n=1 Tax=Fimbriiglobus ruber TaxID=1908690 RepID=A0A225E1F5_9BACT|nr:hypothetical protein [Fimbriiglobus ruber]OWK43319.1 hypothetical protein FRUB_02918 [Fimbriiglobus ruber]